ncbi:hypothetical protein FHX57_001968 [Paraburkholderia tropica]|uniref:hypothetical protein n=1 Tax=Paraburkholderia tropica TaxID=92647 RepID=UPI001606FD40|nr:hypothetical protein [Paraburkholderia tropica]MBB2999637.1 hypothetical protein [Paraburkholderia tropica]
MRKTILIASVSLYMSSGVSLAEEIPQPDLGCYVFDGAGKVVPVKQLSDRQLLQVLHCQQVADSNAQKAAAIDASTAELQKDLAEQKASIQQIREMQPTGGGAQVPYPPPGNARTVILQSQ